MTKKIGKYLFISFQYFVVSLLIYFAYSGDNIGIFATSVILLVLCSIVDIKERKIPRALGWGFLFSSLVYLGVMNDWWLFAFIVITVTLSGTKLFWPTTILLAIVVISNSDQHVHAILGLMLVLGFFNLGYIGGGDAQIWIPMIVFSSDISFTIILLVNMVVIGFFVMFKARGLKGGFKRALFISKNMGNSTTDQDAVKMPWSVVATLSWVAFLAYSIAFSIAPCQTGVTGC